MVTNIRFFSRPLKIYQIPSIPRAPDINGKGFLESSTTSTTNEYIYTHIYTHYILPPAPPLALTGMPPAPPSGPLPLPPVALSRGPSAVTSMHHVTAFFRPEAVRTCQRCHSRFFVQPALHPPDSCKFHRGSYVCRRHPAETKFVPTLCLIFLYCIFHLILIN